MKKVLLVVSLLAGGFALNAQDIIIKENGDEIIVEIVEMGIDEVKYKKFENKSGPTYVISKSELFMIKYQNGDKEVIKIGTETASSSIPISVVPVSAAKPDSGQQPQSAYATPNESKIQIKQGGLGYKKNNFGVDIGVGFYKSNTMADLGVRFLHNFSPYIGWDIINIKALMYVEDFDGENSFIPQLMTGLRVKSPTFGNSMAGFASFKAGGGFVVVAEEFGLCYQFEIGLHLTKKFFVAFAYDHQGGETKITLKKEVYKTKIDLGYSALRLGFNF